MSTVNRKIMLTYENASIMVNDTSLKKGFVVRTLGYTAENDGKGYVYKIVANPANETLLETDVVLSNSTLKAKMLSTLSLNSSLDEIYTVLDEHSLKIEDIQSSFNTLEDDVILLQDNIGKVSIEALDERVEKLENISSGDDVTQTLKMDSVGIMISQLGNGQKIIMSYDPVISASATIVAGETETTEEVSTEDATTTETEEIAPESVEETITEEVTEDTTEETTDESVDETTTDEAPEESTVDDTTTETEEIAPESVEETSTEEVIEDATADDVITTTITDDSTESNTAVVMSLTSDGTTATVEIVQPTSADYKWIVPIPLKGINGITSPSVEISSTCSAKVTENDTILFTITKGDSSAAYYM